MGPRTRQVLFELIRLGVLLVVAGGLLMYVDPANTVVIQAVMIGMFFAGGSHLTRRLLLPYVSMEKLINEARTSSLGAAIVVVSILITVSWVMTVPLLILR